MAQQNSEDKAVSFNAYLFDKDVVESLVYKAKGYKVKVKAGKPNAVANEETDEEGKPNAVAKAILDCVAPTWEETWNEMSKADKANIQNLGEKKSKTLKQQIVEKIENIDDSLKKVKLAIEPYKSEMGKLEIINYRVPEEPTRSFLEEWEENLRHTGDILNMVQKITALCTSLVTNTLIKDTLQIFENGFKIIQSHIDGKKDDVDEEDRLETMKKGTEDLKLVAQTVGDSVRELLRDEKMAELTIELDLLLESKGDEPPVPKLIKLLNQYQRYVLYYGEAFYATISNAAQDNKAYLEKLFSFEESFFFHLNYQFTCITNLITLDKKNKEIEECQLQMLLLLLDNIELQLKKHPYMKPEFRASFFMGYASKSVFAYLDSLIMLKMYLALSFPKKHLNRLFKRKGELFLAHQRRSGYLSHSGFTELEEVLEQAKFFLRSNLTFYFQQTMEKADDRKKAEAETDDVIKKLDTYVEWLVGAGVFAYRGEHKLRCNNCCACCYDRCCFTPWFKSRSTTEQKFEEAAVVSKTRAEAARKELKTALQKLLLPDFHRHYFYSFITKAIKLHMEDIAKVNNSRTVLVKELNAYIEGVATTIIEKSNAEAKKDEEEKGEKAEK